MNSILLSLEVLEPSLPYKLSQLTGIPLEKVACRTFPDGEVCIRINANVSDKTVIIVHSTANAQNIRLQQLYQMVEVAVSQGAKRIISVVPYLAYARQDRRTHPGEPLSGLIVLRTLAMLGVDTLVAIDVHNPAMFVHAPLFTENVSTDRIFADWLRKKKTLPPLLVSPDAGGRQRIEELAKLTGYDYLVCTKLKDDAGHTSYEHVLSGFAGRDAFILDDLCSSGSTFIPFARYLKESGIREIYYGVTHFFADGQTIQDTLGFPVTIIATDTVLTQWSTISVAPLLAAWITRKADV